ncbi:peptide deformylase [Patescibacteria group bacterium]|nr:peptide deformylase [Patescibacteria group bacterium]
MKIDPIVVKGAAVLHKKTHEVPKDMFGTAKLKDIIKRMSASLRETEHGVAIAANQIGLHYSIFVVRGFVLEGKDRSDEDADRAFINPKITKVARKKDLMEEACLSVPGYHGIIKRSLKATVRAYDEEGIRYERGASGLLAQIFQHECDHLEGILYIEKAEEVREVPKEEEAEETHGRKKSKKPQ